MSPIATVSNGLARGRDNFLSLRHILAGCVLVSHAFFVFRGADVREPLLDETGLDLGQHAVNLFFALSGFLVVQSLERRGVKAYARARALRLLPGLVMATLFTAFVIGPIVTSLPLGAYLRDSATWRFLVDIVPRFNGHATLPGVFEDQPANEAMITIWTIKYEIACYALLAIGGFALLRRRPAIVLAACALGFALMSLPSRIVLPDAVHSFARLGMCFAFGVGAWLYRRQMPLDGRFVIGGVLLSLALARTTFGLPVMILAECYGALWLAFLPTAWPGGALSIVGSEMAGGPGLVKAPLALLAGADFSYGIYLYGFPLEQAIFQFLQPSSPWLLIVQVLPVVLIVALGSWLLVEKPALALKSRRAVGELPQSAPVAEGQTS
ncbi:MULTISPECIES: acyltransferase [unclassified Chelatococcus]|uniref:acyltransferase family protein n=1 Tax=unclassified Chelatococcus TaxID=2638111 RepID=UPI001BCF6A49|nr:MULTISPECIES: acyltransferase [unclassified Chelatococcus]CAH1672678.1 Peptidoglycan/LPS O-acetylase OafA/YrhL [Hyphomicrobiales bacterium]MBS7738620.1 acyltransferase [Chelatococcus sp. HY11]MBX3543024.1 acyltransferase [Chelatococcus sp.]MCO5076850.1 acyltransferase [Chelatococcus sp.]CAH1675077.1 Peptidoglycan/LPS O-acetylase OafA/YrhL [Hyphomicrobiales bacterium]